MIEVIAVSMMFLILLNAITFLSAYMLVTFGEH